MGFYFALLCTVHYYTGHLLTDPISHLNQKLGHFQQGTTLTKQHVGIECKRSTIWGLTTGVIRGFPTPPQRNSIRISLDSDPSIGPLLLHVADTPRYLQHVADIPSHLQDHYPSIPLGDPCPSTVESPSNGGCRFSLTQSNYLSLFMT